MGLTGFNRARREAAAAAAEKAEQVDGKVDVVDDAVVNETAAIVKPEVEQVDGKVDSQPQQASKTELRAQADEIALRLGIKTPIVRAGVLDLLAFIDEHK